jgi:hypothetical protein
MASLITVSKKPNFQSQHPNSPKMLSAICLQICGGGLTTTQTAQAMELQSKILANGKATKNKYTITLA